MHRIVFQLISTNYKYTVGQYGTEDSNSQSDVKPEQKVTGYLQDSTDTVCYYFLCLIQGPY